MYRRAKFKVHPCIRVEAVRRAPNRDAWQTLLRLMPDDMGYSNIAQSFDVV